MDQRTIESAPARLRTHCIHMDNRQLISISGVKDVQSFNDQQIQLLTEAGELRIEGEELRITKLNVDDGQVIIEGTIIALEYDDIQEPRGSLISRIFG